MEISKQGKTWIIVSNGETVATFRTKKEALEHVASLQSSIIQDADVVTETRDNVPSATATPHVDGHCERIEGPSAEDLVESLIVAQVATESAEYDAVIALMVACERGEGDPKSFAACFAARAEGRMKATSIAARKSNLKKVLEFGSDRPDYRIKIESEEYRGTGLQGLYALRAEMLKLEKPVKDPAETDAEAEGEAASMPPNDLMLHQITLAIDAAVSAGHDDIGEKLRAVFYAAKAAAVESETSEQ